MSSTAHRQDDDLDRLRAAFAAAPPTPAAAGCPDPDRLWAAARGELAPAETRDVVEHVAACPACTEDWRIAVGLAGDGTLLPGAFPRAIPTMPVPRPRRTWRAGALAVAAAIVVLVGVGLMMRWGGLSTTSEIRGSRGPVVQSLVPASAPLPRDAVRLRWAVTPPAAGARFSVRVTNSALEELIEVRDLARPDLLVPPSALAGVAPGGRIYWRVECDVPGGGRVRSATFTARIR